MVVGRQRLLEPVDVVLLDGPGQGPGLLLPCGQVAGPGFEHPILGLARLKLRGPGELPVRTREHVLEQQHHAAAEGALGLELCLALVRGAGRRPGTRHPLELAEELSQ